MSTGGSASAASGIEVGSTYPTMQELRAAAPKKADTCVAGVVSCEVWMVVGVSSCVGIHIGGIGWNDGGTLVDYKTLTQLKVEQSRQLRCTWGISGKNRRNAF